MVLVKGRALRTVLALYQAGAGLGGLWVLLLSGQFRIHGPLPIRILLVALFTAYCVLLTSAGFLLGRAHALGVPLSVIAQGFQIPQLSSHAFTYVIATPASLVLSVTSRLDIGARAGARAPILPQSAHSRPRGRSRGVRLTCWRCGGESPGGRRPV